MSWWVALLDTVGLLLLLVVAVFVGLFVRRRLLSRTGATFECSVRSRRPKNLTSARGWTLGIGRYADDRLEWFRVFSFSPRPRHVFARTVVVKGRRKPSGAEAFALQSGHQIVDIEQAEGLRTELAMSEGALTGFLAWTEAAPPGHDRLLA